MPKQWANESLYCYLFCKANKFAHNSRVILSVAKQCRGMNSFPCGLNGIEHKQAKNERRGKRPNLWKSRKTWPASNGAIYPNSLKGPGPVVINKFQSSLTILLWNKNSDWLKRWMWPTKFNQSALYQSTLVMFCWNLCITSAPRNWHCKQPCILESSSQ